MKFFSVLLLCAAVALMPAQAQSKRGKSSRAPKASKVVKTVTAAPAATTTAAAAAGKAEEAPKTGIRFVICSPSGVSLPSPLYIRDGKAFKPLQVGSRTPSERVRPAGGVVEFWDRDPGSMAEEGKKAEIPDPIFTVKVPAGIGSKTVCILSPSKEAAKTASLFLNEGDFPRKGMHIVNLSSFPLQITTSETPDFKDKKESKIGVYRREDGICANNSWSFKGKNGQLVSFMLTYTDKNAKMPKRIKASTFTISDRQAIVNLIVKDPTRNVPKLMPIQLAEKINVQ